MIGLHQITLAEFSRVFLHPLDATLETREEPARPAPSPAVYENGYAVQVGLGMSKTNRDGFSGNSPEKAVG